MKKCPYCAEQIQDEALLCRYCNRKIKGILFRRLVKITVLATMIVFAVIYRVEAERFVSNCVNGFNDVFGSFKGMMNDIRESLTVLKDHGQQFKSLNTDMEGLKDLNRRVTRQERFDNKY